MKLSLEKLQKVLVLEAERGYDNHAVLGGLERLLDYWETEARTDGLPENLIQAVIERVRDYSKLKESSRAEALEGLARRIQRSDMGSAFRIPKAKEKRESIQHTVRGLEPDKTELLENEPEIEIESEAEKPPTMYSDRPSFKEIIPQKKRKKVEPILDEIADLDAPITILEGIGRKYAQALSRLGLNTLRDILYYFPYRYNDFSLCKPINRLEYGETLTVIGTIEKVKIRPIKGGQREIVEAIVSDGSGTLKVTWFNQSWQVKKLHPGMQISLSGKIDQYLGQLVMNHPEWERLEQQQIHTFGIIPVYHLKVKISQAWLRRQINKAVTYWAPRVPDHIPEEIRKMAEVIDLPSAIVQIHNPDSWEEEKEARQRFAFDEILLLQLGVLSQKRKWENLTAQKFSLRDEWLNQQIKQFPYTLTQAQKRTINEMRNDLSSGHPMNRLLQGDVGSGKTAIAITAANIISAQGAQTAVMAPTSILAEQHYQNFLAYLTNPTSPYNALLQPSEIRLMLGSTPETEKREIRAGLENGRIKIVIGTHALIEQPVQFNNLQLVVIDEQHRFGVRQRAILREKGHNPHLLVMTATPIPRSLAMTVYGDLDISVMDEMPPGRIPVDTYVIKPRQREQAYNLIRQEVKAGHQAFIIYPLVEESEKLESKAAIEEEERLKSDIFPDLKVGLIHGRMTAEEKDNTMASFHAGELNILVSTTVVEVGVDIPNATVMIIEGANRFGLAQLHQLRGRVGRAGEKSYCILIPDSSEQTQNERLKVMKETNDGFILAEKDLEQRGPGEFLGTRQSGFNELDQAKLTDVHLIEKARRIAKYIFEQDPELDNPEYQLLASRLQHSWQSTYSDII